MNVPFVDLYAQYQLIQEDIDAVISDVIRKSAYIGGEYVEQFEDDFRSYLGSSHCVSCANGTDSLELILKAAGIGPGDEVIVPALSWISTSEAVSAVGALPVFADIDQNRLIDISQVESLITARTKAVIPVHLYGNPVDMDHLMQVATRNKLFVLEDCAQSHGAEIGGRKTGTFGHAASFSFYPGKNLGAYGDAGAIVTNDEQLARKTRALANHGQLMKHRHLYEGRNSRLDGLQAAILSVKLPHLERWTDSRIRLATGYLERLADLPIRMPQLRPDYRHVFHLFVIESDRRDELMSFLLSRNIGCAVHYPRPLPLLECYEHRNFRPEDFPGAGITSAILSLPMFSELTDAQQVYVVSALEEFFG